MVQKKKKKPSPKKKVVKRAKSSSTGTKNVRIPRDNDVKMSEMVDLAAEIFVQTLEISAKIPDKLRSRLIKKLKDAAKEALS